MQTICEKPRLLNPEQAAEFLGVAVGTLAVWRCTARYRIPYIQVGRNIAYDEADLVTWLQSRKVNQAEARP